MKAFFAMGDKKLLLAVAIAVGAVIGVLHWILLTTTCPAQPDPSCQHYMSTLLAFDSGFFLKSIVLVALVLLFFSARVFKWWLWSALVVIPLLT